MAKLGFRKVTEMIGRTDRLQVQKALDHWKAKGLDLSAILHQPEVAEDVAVYCNTAQEHGLEVALDHQLMTLAQAALDDKKPVHASLPIRNVHRTVGAMLSGEISRRYGQDALPDETIRFDFSGTAGQSFGAFCVKGLTLTLEGDANDYTGKGLSGGRIIVYPPKASLFKAEETILIGNTSLYGATSGEAFFYGVAGERFAVRNSGANAVVEGLGDHGCEYMTGGIVVVLGPTGRNFAAGMSGGIAFVLNEKNTFARQCNLSLVELSAVDEADDVAQLKTLVEKHLRYTGSLKAQHILDRWDAMLPHFVKVISVEYKKVLEARKAKALRKSKELLNG